MGDQLSIVNQGGTVTLVGEIYDVGATEGDVLTIQSDGSVAAAAGAGGIPDPITTPLVVQPDPDTGAPLTCIGLNDTTTFQIDDEGNVNNYGDGETFSPTYNGEYINLQPTPGVASLAALEIISAADANDPLVCQAHGATTFQVGGEGFVKIAPDNSNYLLLSNIPTSDPGVAGAVYSIAGALMISAG